MRSEHTERRKSIVKREVERIVEQIQHHRSTTIQRSEQLARQRVNESHAVAQGILNSNKGRDAIEGTKQEVISALRSVSLANRSNYFFILDTRGNVILYPPRPAFEGTASNQRTSQENKVIRELIELVKKDGEGFYSYSWANPAKNNRLYEKVSYIRLFAPFNWIIGTGVYIEEIENQLKKELLSEIFRIKFEPNGYFFIDDWEGVVLTHGAQPELIGTNIWEFTDSQGVKVVQNLIAASKTRDGDFVYYSWKKPDTGEERRKVSFSKGVHEWRWMVGSGVYVDDIEKDIATLHRTLKRELLIQTATAIGVTGIVIIFALMIFNKINRRVVADFEQFSNSMVAAATSGEEIDLDRIRYGELRDMAENSNRLLLERADARKGLLMEKERLSITLRSIADAVISTDIEGRILVMNNSAEKLFECSENEMLGQYLHEQTRFPGLGSLLVAGTACQEASGITVVLPDGTMRSLETASARIMDAEGAAVGAVFVIRDVTEKLNREEELATARKLEALGVLAGAVAHDFNNFLSGMMGNAQLAQRKLDDPDKLKRYLEQIMSVGWQAKELIERILNFSSQSVQHDLKNLQVVELDRMIEDVIQTVSVTLPEGIIIKSDLEKVDLLLPDSSPLRQVIMNLCVNGIQSMKQNGGTLHVSLSGKVLVRIEVRDEGCGIPRESIARIFDPFFTTKQVGEGTGLGLSIAHGVVKSLGGEIEVDSIEGKGSRFTVLLRPVTPETLKLRDETSALRE